MLILCQIFHHFDLLLSNCLQNLTRIRTETGEKIKMVETHKIIKIFSIQFFDHSHPIKLNKIKLNYQSHLHNFSFKLEPEIKKQN